MPELELLRRHYPETEAETGAARERARAALLERIEAGERPRPRRAAGLRRRRFRLALAAAGVAAVAIAGAAALDSDTPGGGTASASAAEALMGAAEAARSQPMVSVPSDGRFLYLRSVEAYLATTDIGASWLEPRVRETWLRPGGGRARVTWAPFEGIGPKDRASFEERGLPVPAAPERARWSRVPPPERLDLPSDPDELFERLHDEASGHSEGTNRQMFGLVRDGLLDPSATTPEQRAALYEAAARIPGVELDGRARDRAGRPGIAVSIRNEPDGRTDRLIFDPATGALLASEEIALPGNGFGYPPGRAIGYATYASGVVGAVGERPRP
jgi:hypothetical protein